jgi:hypothetical protein
MTVSFTCHGSTCETSFWVQNWQESSMNVIFICFPHYNAWRLWTQFSPFAFQYIMSLLLSYDWKHSLICVDNWARKLVKNILTCRYRHMSAILIFKGPMYLTLWQLVIFTPLEMGCKCWCLILFQFLVSCVCMHVLVCMGHTQHKQEFLLTCVNKTAVMQQ